MTFKDLDISLAKPTFDAARELLSHERDARRPDGLSAYLLPDSYIESEFHIHNYEYDLVNEYIELAEHLVRLSGEYIVVFSYRTLIELFKSAAAIGFTEASESRVLITTSVLIDYAFLSGDNYYRKLLEASLRRHAHELNACIKCKLDTILTEGATPKAIKELRKTLGKMKSDRYNKVEIKAEETIGFKFSHVMRKIESHFSHTLHGDPLMLYSTRSATSLEAGPERTYWLVNYISIYILSVLRKNQTSGDPALYEIKKMWTAAMKNMR